MREQPVFKTLPQSQMILRDFDAPVDEGDQYVQRLTSYLQVNLRFTIKSGACVASVPVYFNLLTTHIIDEI